MTLKRSVTWLSAMAFVTGCHYGADFTPTGADYAATPGTPEGVRLATERPGPGYLEVGLLTGSGGSFEGAIKRIKNEAAAQGCDVVVVLGEAVQSGYGTPGGAYGITQNHVRASCYVSASTAKAETHAASGGTLPPRATVPRGAAGFTFGEALEEANAGCVGAEKEWRDQRDGGRCSGGAQETGFAGPVNLTACDGHICAIDVDATPPETANGEWPRVFGAIRRTLTKKYGESSHDIELPADCGETVPACLREGRAHATMTWSWPEGITIELKMHALDRETKRPALHISYRTAIKPQTAPAPKPEPQTLPNPAAL